MLGGHRHLAERVMLEAHRAGRPRVAHLILRLTARPNTARCLA
jgi:hypothetical protein